MHCFAFLAIGGLSNGASALVVSLIKTFIGQRGSSRWVRGELAYRAVLVFHTKIKGHSPHYMFPLHGICQIFLHVGFEAVNYRLAEGMGVLLVTCFDFRVDGLLFATEQKDHAEAKASRNSNHSYSAARADSPGKHMLTVLALSER